MRSTGKIIKVNATGGEQAGEINLQWNSEKNAQYFILEMKSPKGKQWKIVDIVNEPKYLLEKLRSKCRYIFRVSIMYKNGQSKKSRTAAIKAP